jgi:hypothetical protein
MISTDRCPGCGEVVTDLVHDAEGHIISHHVLVADWHFHAMCWIKMIHDHPPDDEEDLDFEGDDEGVGHA